MVKSRSAFAIALSLGGLWCARAKTQETRPSSGAAPRVLFLERQHSGQHFEARAGDQVEIRLGSRGGCEPLISSPSLRLEGIALSWPPTPGISTRTYIFDAASAGEAEVRIPLTDCTNSEVPEDRAFVATIRVEQTARGATTPYAFRMADQDNAVSWTGAWTILGPNVLRQSFTPSVSRLTGVEVQLANANPGPAQAGVDLTLLNAKGDILSVVSRSVSADECEHVFFALPTGGWAVTPGQPYSIGVSSGDRIFGWKYVVGGYKNGAASFNEKPLLRDARSSFLFRTFGTR